MSISDDLNVNAGRIARAWLSYHDSEDEEYFWAVEELLRLVFENPQKAWNVVSRVNEFSASHELREYLDGIIAAGPLEDLVHAHGTWLISQLLNQPTVDERLRDQLRLVYFREGIAKVTKDKLLALTEK